MSFFAYEEGFCFDLATHVGAPDQEGVAIQWFDFIHDQCRAYSSQLQPAVAKKVYSCLKAVNDARPRETPTDGDSHTYATVEFDAMKMYQCGHDALWSICSQGVDGRVRDRAQRIANMLKSRGDTRVLSVIVDETAAVLSGLKSAARADLETCVKAGASDLYSCIEGMTISFNTEGSEPAPSASEACVPAGQGSRPTSCDTVLSKIASEEGVSPYLAFAKAQCETYLTKFQPGASKAAIDCLLNPNAQAYPNIYACGVTGLKKTCRTTEVDAVCKEIVDSITAVDRNANKNGRVTRQCRTLLPGLTAAARGEVKSCVPGLARAFSGSPYASAADALYSCIEGL